MQKNEKIIKKKEFYELWYEWLQESEAYKQYCEKEKGLPPERERGPSPAKESDPDFKRIASAGTFDLFGDIHMVTFQDWYKRRGAYCGYGAQKGWVADFCSEAKPVTDFLPVLRSDIDGYLYLFHGYQSPRFDNNPLIINAKRRAEEAGQEISKKNEPNFSNFDPEQFIDFLLKKYSEEMFLYLQINCLKGSFKELTAKVKDCIKEKLETTNSQQNQYIKPLTKNEFEIRKRQLDVYREAIKTTCELINLTENNKLDIIDKLKQKHKIYNRKEGITSSLKALDRDIKAANKILKNVEENKLPFEDKFNS